MEPILGVVVERGKEAQGVRIDLNGVDVALREVPLMVDFKFIVGRAMVYNDHIGGNLKADLFFDEKVNVSLSLFPAVGIQVIERTKNVITEWRLHSIGLTICPNQDRTILKLSDQIAASKEIIERSKQLVDYFEKDKPPILGTEYLEKEKSRISQVPSLPESMKEWSNQPAYPLLNFHYDPHEVGFSKREAIAKDVLCALVSNKSIVDNTYMSDYTLNHMCETALNITDKFINQLNSKSNEKFDANFEPWHGNPIH